ncbi:hypothetical protein H6P81_016953 [Aristolochia fimbriata]|uniref:Uncharacterized protein n=1 Tax=Aristolochia fimbriata TaxID=158543 RepID=A0AAV7DYL2_ARIFI|nr:hypothetical protein H6P81_016953 [Aristolochia fimbriata]
MEDNTSTIFTHLLDVKGLGEEQGKEEKRDVRIHFEIRGFEEEEEARETKGHGSHMEEYDEDLLKDVESAIEPFTEEYPTISIHIVPETIRRVQQDAYMPNYQRFSLLYTFDQVYPRESLKSHHATRHAHSILSRNPTRSLEDYLVAMSAYKDKIKMCHYVTVEIDLKQLLLLLFSGFFIVDVLLMFYEERLKPKVDTMCVSNIQDLWMDMLLLPNQVPFFSLQLIFDMAVVDKSKYPSLVDLSVNFFAQFVSLNTNVHLLESQRVHHLLHLIHCHLLPSNPQNPSSCEFHNPLKSIFSKLKNQLPCQYSKLPISTNSTDQLPSALTLKPIYSATRLTESGIKFRKKEGHGFMDITFKKGILEIPYIQINGNTHKLLRNLAAWEQCDSSVGTYFTSYSIFMDLIVNTEKDVDILSKSGIIRHTLGTDTEVASVFNNLSACLACRWEESFLPQLSINVNEYCDNKINIWWAKLMNDYFHSPWAGISLVAGILLILLNTIQSLFFIYNFLSSR